MTNKQSLNDKNTENALAQEHEMQATITQWCDLRQQGKYDEAAELWAKSRKKDEALNQDLVDRIKNIHKPPFANSKYRKPFLFLIILFSIFFFGGFILESTVGKIFMLTRANTYRELGAPIYFVLLAIATPISFIFFKKDPYIRNKYPTKLVRWIFLFPFFSCGFAFLTLTAPLGWAALYSWAFGSYADKMDARIISVEPYYQSARTHCNRYAKLEFRDDSARICIEGIIIGHIPQPNEKVLIAGKVSWFGIYIEQIRTQSK